MWKTVSSWLHASLCALGVISFAARPSARPNRVLCAVCHILQCVIFIFCAACSARCGLQAVCVISFTASELNCDGMRAARNNSFHIQTCCANSFFSSQEMEQRTIWDQIWVMTCFTKGDWGEDGWHHQEFFDTVKKRQSLIRSISALFCRLQYPPRGPLARKQWKTHSIYRKFHQQTNNRTHEYKDYKTFQLSTQLSVGYRQTSTLLMMLPNNGSAK